MEHLDVSEIGECLLVPAPFRFPMAERRSIGRWTRLTREFQLSCSLAGAPIRSWKLPQQQQQRSQQNIRSFQHDPVCLHAPIIIIKRNKQVLGSRFWNRFLDQTVLVSEYSSTRHSPNIDTQIVSGRRVNLYGPICPDLHPLRAGLGSSMYLYLYLYLSTSTFAYLYLYLGFKIQEYLYLYLYLMLILGVFEVKYSQVHFCLPVK